MPGAIPEILEYAFGPDLHAVDGNADFAVTGVFESVEAFLTYRDHPQHVAFMTEVLAPRLEQRTAVQMTLP